MQGTVLSGGDGSSADDIEMNKRVVIDARAPTLRIVRGGVRKPNNLVDVYVP